MQHFQKVLFTVLTAAARLILCFLCVLSVSIQTGSAPLPVLPLHKCHSQASTRPKAHYTEVAAHCHSSMFQRKPLYLRLSCLVANEMSPMSPPIQLNGRYTWRISHKHCGFIESFSTLFGLEQIFFWDILTPLPD